MTHRRNIPALLIGLVLLAPALAHAAGASDKKQKGDYLPIAGLAATVMRADGAHGVITVEAGVDVPNAVLRGYADQVQPRLRDAYAQVLQGYAGGLAPGMTPDVDYLARQLQNATDRVLGKPGARLLIGGVMVN